MALISFQKLVYFGGKFIILQYMRLQEKVVYEASAIIDSYRAEQDKQLNFGIKESNQTTQQGDGSESMIMRRVFSKICSQIKAIKLWNLSADYKIVDVLTEFQFNQLECLDLWNCKIQETGVKKLVQKYWPSLNRIVLDNGNIGDEGFLILINSQIINQLKYLRLSQNGITSKSLKAFSLANLSNLAQLRLQVNQIGKRGAQYLSKSKLPQLKSLIVLKTGLTNESIKNLTKTQWPNLKDLQISLNYDITSDCLAYLERAIWKLERLWISNTSRLLQSGQQAKKEYKIQIDLNKNEFVEGKDTFLNANVLFFQLMVY